MKNILIILIVFLGLGTIVKAQDKTISTNISYTAKGAAGDTAILSDTKTYAVYVNAFCQQLKVGVKQTRTRGAYTKARAIIQSSLDYANWTAIDTVSFATATTSTYGTSDLLTPVAPYFRVLFKPYDSTQTVKYQYYITVERK